WFEERIMSAPENQGINPPAPQGPEVFAEDLAGHAMVQPAFFDQRNKERTGAREHFHRVIAREQSVTVSLASNGGARADHTDSAGVRSFQGGADSGQDDAEDGDLKSFLKSGERPSGGGIAGYDHGLDVLLEQEP